MKQYTRFSLLLLLLLFWCVNAQGQTLEAEVFSGFGHAPEQSHQDHEDCLPAAQREVINQQVEANIAMLKMRGIIPAHDQESIVALAWPLRPKAGLTDPSYYSIGNYVDENSGTGTLDYNCGARTYNGHRGTDIGLWPFGWNRMANNDVETVAAAAGTIVLRQDGNFDQNCSWNGQQGNGIIIRHADGSRTWYWHFKKNTLTNKAVGAAVAAGEYLGVVGSSGISTGPHLHFEVDRTEGQTLVDPWGGSCNYLGGQSWWSAQKPYYDPKICKIMTHNAAPTMSQCPAGENMNASNTFQPGQLAYFAGYFRDYLPQTNATYTVKRPDGTTWNTWTVNNVTSYYNTAYWWWSAYLPANGPTGTWKFQVTYQGQTQVHSFTVGSATCNTPSGLFTSNITQTSAKANWTAVSGAASYTVQYQVGSGAWNNVAGSPFTTPYATINGLQASTNYAWRVRTNCTSGLTSSWSSGVAFTTLGAICAIPTGLYTSNITQNTATIGWNAASGALSYTVQFYINGSWVNLGGGNVTGTTVNVYGLYASTSYQWRVATNCSNGQSAFSSSYYFSTVTAPNCTTGIQFPAFALTPASNWQYQTQVWGGEYCLVNVQSGQTYTFSYCSANGGLMGFDGEISIRTTSNQLIAYADDVCGAAPRITWQAGFTGQVRVLLTKYQCSSQATNSTMAYRIGSSFAGSDPDEITTTTTRFLSMEPGGEVAANAVELETEVRDTKPGAMVNDAGIGDETVFLQIFPNPAAGQFAVQLDNHTDGISAVVKILDPMGRVLWTEQQAPGSGLKEWQVQVSDWPNGVYFLHVTTSDGRVYSTRVQVAR